MSAQDPSIKNNPWLLRRVGDRDDLWTVPSASGGPAYTVDLSALGAPWASVCSCPCQQECWHVHTARLRVQLDRVAANARRYYARFTLTALQSEDRRLRRLFDRHPGDHFLRAQYTALGEMIEASTLEPPAAA